MTGGPIDNDDVSPLYRTQRLDRPRDLALDIEDPSQLFVEPGGQVDGEISHRPGSIGARPAPDRSGATRRDARHQPGPRRDRGSGTPAAMLAASRRCVAADSSATGSSRATVDAVDRRPRDHRLGRRR